MKKCLIILILLMVSIVAADGAYIRFVAEEVTPEPVQPGQDLTVKIRLYNDGTLIANNIILSREFEFPFKLKSVSQDTTTFSSIAPRSSREETFYLTISPKAKSGTYPLKFKIQVGEFTRTEEILVNILGKPEVILETEELKNLVPNSEFELVLNVKNIGSGGARNVKITSNFENIGPVGSNVIHVEKINSGNNTKLNIPFRIGNIEPGFYQIPFEIEMINEKGETVTNSQKISLNIVHKAEVALQNLKINPGTIQVGGKVNIEVRLENIGEGNADNVNVELKFEPNEGLSGSKISYVGQLEKDDDAPAIFTLTGTAANKYKGTLFIHYTDDLGEHTTEESFGLSVVSSGFAWYWYALIIAVIAAGVIFYKKKK